MKWKSKKSLVDLCMLFLVFENFLYHYKEFLPKIPVLFLKICCPPALTNENIDQKYISPWEGSNN